MNKSRIINPNNNIVRDYKSRTTENFYILSKHQGLTQYYPGRKQNELFWSRPDKRTPSSLQNI